MSSLAIQLQSIASLDAGRLTSRTGAPSSKSYLFPPKVAGTHDLDSIFLLGQSGFEELLTLDSKLGDFEDELFSESAKHVDRMLLSPEENDRLNQTLERCLRRLGPWVGVMAGGKCIEWLVRRFRVHEMNAEIVLQVFLPYHETQNFARILAILTVPLESPYYAPFSSLVKKSQPIPRSYISNDISAKRDPSLRLLTDVVGLIKAALKEGVVHRALLAFWSGVVVDLLQTGGTRLENEEGTVKILVEAFVGVLTTKHGGKDVNAATYCLLVLLSRKVRLADPVFLVILEALLSPKSGADPVQRILTLLVMLQERPGWEKGLGPKGPERLVGFPELEITLLAAITKYGFEIGVSNLLRVLFERLELHAQAVSKIADLPSLSDHIVTVITESALASSDPFAIQILSRLREIHPALVDKIAVSHPNANKLHSGSTSNTLDIHSADVSARIRGIQHALENGTADGQDQEEARTMLLTRLRDDEEEVIKAIYSRPQALSEMLAGKSDAYVNAVEPAMRGHRRNPEIMALHLQYACTSFAQTEEQQSAVFRRLLWPCLLDLSSLPSLGARGWKVVHDSPAKTWATFGSLFKKPWKPVTEIDGIDRISQSIAEVFKSNPARDAFINFLLHSIEADFAPSSLLAYRVLANMIMLTGDAAIATRVLGQIQPTLVKGKMRDVGESDDPQSHLCLKAIFEHPTDELTLLRASTALIAALSAVKRGNDERVCLRQQGESTADHGVFQKFATSCYEWCNSGTLPGPLSQILLRTILAQLREDALVFFASIWTTTTGSRLQLAALRHAQAFVTAYANSPNAVMDFQLVLPALLMAVQLTDRHVRAAAVQVLKVISDLASCSTEETYAVDTIYGSRSDMVQLLRHSDLQRYLVALAAAGDNLELDPDHIREFHVSYLGSATHAHKKRRSHRRAIIAWFISQIRTSRSCSFRIAIIRLLAEVNDSTIFAGILPLLSDFDEAVWLDGLPESQRTAYVTCLFKTLNVRAASKLSEESSEWRFLEGVLGASAETSPLLRSALVKSIDARIFAALSSGLQTAFASVLLSSRDESEKDGPDVSHHLARLHLPSSVLVSLITNQCHSLETSGRAKRQKQTPGTTTKADDVVTTLTVLIDATSWKAFPGDPDLIAALMSLLSALSNKQPTINEGAEYLQQEILGALHILIEKVQDPQDIQRAQVSVDVIIKVIRASNNPRTTERALLVISELATLSPDAVLHHVMPIFTFMGANDFQRDDAYSFQVVEKTISRIVPVLTESLKSRAQDRLSLCIESLPMLNIFADMAGRLPKHRTLPFFVHLLKCLDATVYLPAACLVLVDRTTNKAGRGGLSIAQVMDLPIQLSASFPISERLSVVQEFLVEVNRLATSAEGSLLDRNPTDVSAERRKRQLNALLTFSTAVLKPVSGDACDQDSVASVVDHCIQVASIEDIDSSTVQPAFAAAMRLLSAQTFFAVVQRAVQIPDHSKMALQALVERLPKVKREIRIGSVSILRDITSSISVLLMPTTATSALAALHAIIMTADKGEDPAIAQAVPAVLKAIELPLPADQRAALSLLDAMIRHLGPRIIPHAQLMVKELLLSIDTRSGHVTREALATLATLIDTIPTFLSAKQGKQIIQTTLGPRNDVEEGTRKVMSTISRKVPTKTLFGVLIEIWSSLQDEEMDGYFEILKMAIRNADRQSLSTMTKSVFSFFLEAFDRPQSLRIKGLEASQVEMITTSIIGSFLELVTKMNESTFKPFFIRLNDWAVIDTEDLNDDKAEYRKTVLLRIMQGLLEKFKNLLSPYISILLPLIQDQLSLYASSTATQESVWTLILKVLALSFEVDEGAFWTDSTLLKIIPSLVSQLAVSTTLLGENTMEHPVEDALTECLASLAGCTTSENVLRSLNNGICLETRKDDVGTRLSAVRALEAIWERQGEEMMALIPETAREFLSELLEDENADVIAATRRTLGKIEKVGGELQEYLG